MGRVVLLIFVLVPACSLAYDLVIKNGRVMDPESGMDKLVNVAIKGNRIVAMSADSFQGDEIINAKGLIVAPGFIDLHAHGQDKISNQFQAADGVTTAMELEIGVYPVADWYQSRAGNAPINYGASVSHLRARAIALHATEAEALTKAAHQDLTLVEKNNMLNFIRQGMSEGGLGIGVGITYSPAASHEEIFNVFELGAELKRPVFIHMRSPVFFNDDLLGPLQEVIANAVITGASLHVVHINSSLNDKAKIAVNMIRSLQAKGVDVTTENYPYTAGSTRLESALFDNWSDNYDLLQWVATGERLTKKSFAKYRKQGGWVIIHGRSEEMNAWLVKQPDLIIASDGIPFVDGLSHPRSAGTFARILGRYVREQKILPLMQALAKMTIMPAKRLENFVADMKRKGRLKVGADADITIFDPLTIVDRATYTQPAQHSEGIKYVIVNGVPVIFEGRLMENVLPGQAVRVN